MVTLQDVARAAGVSVAAASHALGARSTTISLSPETRERVRAAAEQLNYRRHLIAAGLRTGRSYHIGLCVDSADLYMRHPFAALLYWVICETAGKRGYRASLLTINTILHVDERLMDGCIVLGSTGAQMRSHIARLTKVMPVLDMIEMTPGVIKLVDDTPWAHGRRQAAQYLYDMGHRHIAVGWRSMWSPQSDPMRQFEEEAKQRRIAVKLEQVHEGRPPRLYPGAEKLPSLDPLPTAFMAIDDDHAYAAVTVLARHGLRVPQDISVFSGNVMPDPGPFIPAMTGFDLDYDLRYSTMTERFLDIIESGKHVAQVKIPQPRMRLIERQSCAPPRSHALPR